MSIISNTHNSLRSKLARDFKDSDAKDDRIFGAPLDQHYEMADAKIDGMSNTELLTALSLHEDVL